MSELIKNAIFRVSVEGNVSPSTREGAEAIKTLAAEEKAAAAEGDKLVSSQDKVVAANARVQASYDATAKKMASLVAGMKEGGKAVLTYTALDGTLKKVAVELGTNAAGAVVLKNELKDMATEAGTAKSELNKLREEAAKKVEPVVAQVVVPPVVPDVAPVLNDQPQGATSATIERLRTVLPQLRGELRAFVEDLLQLENEGGATFESLAAVAKQQFATVEEALGQALGDERTKGLLATAGAALTSEQRQFVDLLASTANLSEEQKRTAETALQLGNALRIQADAEEIAATKAQIYINQLAQLRAKYDEVVAKSKERSAAGVEQFDPTPFLNSLEGRIAEAQKGLTELKLPAGSELQKSVELALKPLGAGAEEAKKMADESRKIQPAIVPAVREVVSLQVQYKQAKAELDRLIEASQDGEVTPDIAAAAEKAGELQNRMQTLNEVVSAFNPDQRFRALIGVMQNSLGAFAAVQGAMGLIGVEGEAVEKTLLKVQSAMALMGGLQTLFGGLKDNLRIIRLQFAQIAVAARAAAVSEAQAAAGATTASTAHKGLAGALVVVRGGFNALWASLVANPLGLVVAAIGVMVATVYQLVTANERATFSADELFKAMERASEVDVFKATRAKSENSIESERLYLEDLKRIAEERAKIGENASDAEKARADVQQQLALQEAERNRRRRDSGIEEQRIIEDIARAQREQAAAQKALDDNFLDRLAAFQTGGEADFTKEELETIAKLQEKREEARKQERDGVAALNAARGKARNENLKAELDNESAILNAKKRLRDAQKNENPLAGSVAAARAELQRLQKLAQEVPQDAFQSGVLESLTAAIRKAEADLKRLEQTFVDDSAERLAERQRNVAALADVEAREAVNRAKLAGASADEIAQLEATAASTRLRRLVLFEEEKLRLLIEGGKATDAELEAQRNRITEAQRAYVAGSTEGETNARNAVRDRLLAELAEEERHALAIAELDSQAAATRARNAGKSELDVQRIEEEGEKERLRIRIDYARKQLEVLRASGTATKAEVQAQQNALRELELQLDAPETEDGNERLKELVGRVTDAAQQIADAGFAAWNAWDEAQTASLDRQLDNQRRRVSDAEKVAEQGNAIMFEAERKRLEEITREREKAARRTAAIAQLEAGANAAVAITRAAAEGGGFLSAITIASTIIALTAGLIRARSLAENSVPSFFHGGEAPSWAGGYTGDGSPHQPSNAVGRKPYRYERREFVMDHVVTGIGNNKAHFEKILRNRVDLDKLLGNRQQAVALLMGASGGMSAKQGDRLIAAIENQPRDSWKIDARGFTRATWHKYQRTQRMQRKR